MVEIRENYMNKELLLSNIEQLQTTVMGVNDTFPSWWFKMICITGDKHADFRKVFYFCYANEIILDDIW